MPDPDPGKSSGSMQIRMHNTGLYNGSSLRHYIMAECSVAVSYSVTHILYTICIHEMGGAVRLSLFATMHFRSGCDEIWNCVKTITNFVVQPK